MARSQIVTVVSAEHRKVLEQWVRAHGTGRDVLLRCRIVLRAAEGGTNRQIADDVDTSVPTVRLWRQRFAEGGPDSLRKIARGRGRKSQGVSPATVQRIWKAHNLQPHRVTTFKLSNDKHFMEKLSDVVGLYLNPPVNALVLSMDEKSQIQALDRTQKSLPIKPGRAGTMTHDYKRNGVTTLFAALNMLTGVVTGMCLPRHRHQEFLKFLRLLDRTYPGIELHLILDNYQTHKHPNVKKWLAKHPNFHLHFIPTSSSWLNMIERWFGELTDKAIRRGAFHSVDELITAIHEYLDTSNKDPQPFVWTATAESIAEKVNRGKAKLETLH